MLCRNTFDSAESRRIAISLRPISSEKKIVGMLLPMAAERAMSSASVDLPSAGRAAMMISCPGCRPFVSESSSANPVGTPTIWPPRPLASSISSEATLIASMSGT